MITRIKLENYRSFKEAEFELKPLTVLIGPVAGGKSNFFKGLITLINSTYRELKELFPVGQNEFWRVRNRLAKPTDSIGFEVEFDEIEDFPGERARYILQIAESPPPNGLYILKEELIKISPGIPEKWIFRRDERGARIENLGDLTPYDPSILNESRRKLYDPSRKEDMQEAVITKMYRKEVGIHPGNSVNDKALNSALEKMAGIPPLPYYLKDNDDDLRFIKNVAESLPAFGYYHLEASSLKSAGEGRDLPGFSYLGKRLPDHLAWLKSNREYNVYYYQIIKDLEKLLPNFQDLLITQAGPEEQSIEIHFNGHRGNISSAELSDGTMFALGILCIVHHPFKPNFICIEEPETGLHPRLMRWLFDRLMDLAYSDDGKRTQVIISTHSPYFLDLLGEMEDSVLVVEQRDGESVVTPLAKILKILRHDENSAPLGYEWASGLFEGLLKVK